MADSTTINTGTYTTSTTNYCPQRLPCGYCVLLSRACPMQGNTTITPGWDPNWYKVYCNATAPNTAKVAFNNITCSEDKNA